MIQVRPYIEGDEKLFERVEPQVCSRELHDKLWKELVPPEWSWTGYEGSEIVGIAGIIPYEDNAYVWLLLNKDMVERKSLGERREMIDLIRKTVRFAESYRFDYIWSYVLDGFEAGHRLMKFLGFERGEKVGECWKYIKELRNERTRSSIDSDRSGCRNAGLQRAPSWEAGRQTAQAERCGVTGAG